MLYYINVMKELLLFICTILTSPDCYSNPQVIVVEYESNQLCHKIAQISSAALIQQNLIKGWLIGYKCEDGSVYFTPDKGEPIIPIPDDKTTG